MTTFWLKMIGTAEKPWQDRPYDHAFVGFRGRKPSGIHRGDHLVLYAVGGSKRIFALGEVTKEWYRSENKDWPYFVDVHLEVNLAPSSGVSINEVGASEWVHRKIRRRSHVKLTLAEYELAARKLREAKKGEVTTRAQPD
jgi:hypothetical protein